MLFAAFLLPREALAAVTVTPATGGQDLTVVTYAQLTGPAVTEAASAEVGTGNIVLRAPAGFQFDPARNVTATATAAAGNCGGQRSLELNGASSQTVAPVAGQITVRVSRASSGRCQAKITWSGIFVRATAQGSGAITKAGGSAIVGVNDGATSFGALSTAPALSLTIDTGAADFGTGLGPDGAASSLPSVVSYPDGDAGAYYVRNGAAGASAVSVTVNSTAPYTGSVSATENSGTSGVSISGGGLRWTLGDMGSLAAAQAARPFGTTPDATVFDAASRCASGQPGQQGECTFDYDYGLRVLWTDAPGAFDSVVTYSARQ